MRKAILSVCFVLAGCGGGRETTRAITPGYRSESWTWHRLSHELESDHPEVVLYSYASPEEGVYCPAGNLPHWGATVKTLAYSPAVGSPEFIRGYVLEKWVLDIPLFWYGSGPPGGHALITWAWDLEQLGEVIPEVGAGYSMMGMFRGIGGMTSERYVWPGDRFWPGTTVRKEWSGGSQHELPLTHLDERITLCVGTESDARSKGLQDALSGESEVQSTPNRLSVSVTIYPPEN